MLQVKQNQKIHDIIFQTFPNGELNLQLNHSIFNKSYEIILNWQDDKDFIKLYFLVNYLKQLNVFNNCNGLILPYLPYSRMDRIENNNMFSLKYIANFINQFCFKNVFILEPHSDKSLQLIKNIQPIYSSIQMLYNYLSEINEDITIVFPDKGAYDRYNKLIDTQYINQIFNYKYNIQYCKKERDFKTGQIKNIQLNDCNKIYNRVVIVDDLCSKGGTFVGCKNAILENNSNVKYFDLIITHVEFNSIIHGPIFEQENDQLDVKFNKLIITNLMMNNKLDNLVEMMFYVNASMRDLNIELIDFKNFFLIL